MQISVHCYDLPGLIGFVSGILRLADLFNRHWQHYYADPDGWNWLEYPLFLIPGGFI